jgi:hypothetical protein
MTGCKVLADAFLDGFSNCEAAQTLGYRSLLTRMIFLRMTKVRYRAAFPSLIWPRNPFHLKSFYGIRKEYLTCEGTNLDR